MFNSVMIILTLLVATLFLNNLHIRLFLGSWWLTARVREIVKRYFFASGSQYLLFLLPVHYLVDFPHIDEREVFNLKFFFVNHL